MDWVQIERESSKFGYSWDYMNSRAIWMGPRVIESVCVLEAQNEQALMGSKSHGQPLLLNEGYLSLFGWQGTDI